MNGLESNDAPGGLPTPPSPPSSQAAAAWIPALAEFLRKAAPARAVMWDDARTELSVATVGPVDEQMLRACLEETLTLRKEAATSPPVHDATPPDGLSLRRVEEQNVLEKQTSDALPQTTWTWRRIPWPSPAEAAGLNHSEEDEWRFLAIMAALCGVLGVVGLGLTLADFGPPWLGPVFYVMAMIAGGWDAAREALPNLLRGRPDIHFLMLAVAAGASFIGAFGEGALLLFLFSFAGALEHFALYRTHREINSLFRAAPKTATLIDEATGTERLVPVETIKPEDRLLIRPGDVFPVDGVALSGDSAADESSLTGEAHPVNKRTGDPVYSGTVNQWGVLEIRCTSPASQSSLQKVIHLIREARNQRAPSQRFTDRFGPGYTLGVLGITMAMFFVWWLAFDVPPFENTRTDGLTKYSAFYRAMTLLVVASPCALVLSIPSAILAAIAWGARHGILFRGGAAIEELSGIKTVALDKTGTLTTGDLKVVSVESFPPGLEKEVATLAYTLELKASHPIARAIGRYGQTEGLTPYTVDQFRSLTGKGVQANINDEPCLLGRRELLEQGPLAEWARNLPAPPEGLSEIWFLQGNLLGRILLEDRIRTESSETLRLLRQSGLHVVMLTGDRSETAHAVAQKIGLDDVRAGLSPAGKVEAINALKKSHGRVAMVGDGINDAPSLAAADVAVAMGARGSDAALEQSDVVLMNDRIENFHQGFLLSRRARRIIRQNIGISLGTILVMVGAAVFGIVPITLGVLAHEGSTVLVCLNSMRLLRSKTRAASK